MHDTGSMEGFYAEISDTHFQSGSVLHDQMKAAVSGGRLMDKWILFLVLQEMDSSIMEIIFHLSESGMVVVAYVVTTENIEEFCMMNSPNRRVIPVTPDLERTIFLTFTSFP